MTEAPRAAQDNVIYRHSLPVRITHWVNAVALILLLMSGLNIFNAHAALYWGRQSHFDRPAAAIDTVRRPDGEPAGVTRIGEAAFDTTGVLGLSRGNGRLEAQGFPSWATVPGYRDLAAARRWHFFFAWVLVLNAAAYLAAGFASRHIQRDLWAPLRQWKAIPQEVWAHVRLRFPTGEAARSYNVLQKLSYLGVIFVLGPLIVLTGLSMSPAMNAATHGLLPDLFGGRQSARTVHFICAALFALFIVVHLAMVALSGPLNNLRSMITGRYALPRGRREARP